jgi:hypothetical protein
VGSETMACGSRTESIGICQSTLGSAKRSVQFIIGTDCVINRKINDQCC